MSDGKEINWVAWILGIGGTIVTAALLWIIQFLVFGFEEYIKDVAGTAKIVDPATVTTLQNDVSTIKTTLTQEAEKNKEFREQQAEDMRNLIRIISEQ